MPNSRTGADVQHVEDKQTGSSEGEVMLKSAGDAGDAEGRQELTTVASDEGEVNLVYRLD